MRFQPSNARTLATSGTASVSVPVLSNTMVSAWATASKYFDPFTMKPSCTLWLMAERTEMEPVNLRAHE